MIEANLTNYTNVFKKLKDFNISEIDLLDAIQKSMRSAYLELEDFDYHAQEIVYQFMWLMFVRTVRNRQQMAAFIPMYFDLIKSNGRTLKDLQDELLITEKSFGHDAFSLENMDVEMLKADILDFRGKLKM